MERLAAPRRRRPSAAAAWNPVAGFSDPAGGSIWAALGDPALLPAPYGAAWVGEPRDAASVAVERRAGSRARGRAPSRAGHGVPPRGRQGADRAARVTYRVRRSAFHDNTRMTAADAVYPYVFAARWGARAPGGRDTTRRSTRPPRRRAQALVGFKVVRVDSEVRKYGDITFTYVVPVVEVYLNVGLARIPASWPRWRRRGARCRGT